MKILIMSRFKKDLTLENLECQMDIYLFHIVKYFSAMQNVELIYADCLSPGWSKRIRKEHEKYLNIPEADHCLIVSQRGIRERPDFFYTELRKKIKGAICTFSSSVCKVGNEDVLFYCVPEGKKNKKNCRLMGWAANENLCKPKQNSRVLTILIDHSYYSGTNKLGDIDISDKVLYDVCNFAKDYERKYVAIMRKKSNQYSYVKVVVKRFCSGGVEYIDIDNPYVDYYNHVGLPYHLACEEYCKADIFVVTHMECMGLSVLESAMAGALIVSAKNGIYSKWDIQHQIRPSLLYKLNYVEYDCGKESIPWETVLNKIDKKKSRELAMRFTWKKASNVIFDTLINFDKYKDANLIFKNDSVGDKYRKTDDLL